MFSRNRKPGDFNAEVEAHLELEAERLKEQGLSDEEARTAARRAFGNVTQAQERFYESTRWLWLDHLWQDVRFALRLLARHRAFTAVAVITLALGIGANTAIFSLLNCAVQESLPISRPQELAQLTLLQRGHGGGSNFNWPDYGPLLEPHPALPGLFAYLTREVTLRYGDASERVRVHQVSGAYYTTLGVQALLGRTLGAADDRPGAAPVAVLSYAYWRRRFALDPSTLGITLYLGGTPVTVVGVTPPSFYGLDRLSPPDIICPLHSVPLPDGFSYYVYFFTRLGSATTRESARATVTARFRARLDGELKPERSWMGDIKLEVLSAPAGEHDARLRLGETLLVLGLLVGIVLLICCTNLASLLLGQGTARSREIGVRLALGAGRWRLIRQLLTESILLGLGGGCLGVLIAYGGHSLLLDLLALDRSPTLQFRLNLPLLAFTAAISLLAGIVFGLVPALRVTRFSVQTSLRGEPPATGKFRLGPTRAFLIVQVAASVVLIFGATLFVRTLRNLEAVNTGFDREHLLLMTIDPSGSRLQGERVTGLLDELMERIPAQPGVHSAALASVPLFGASAIKNVWVLGATRKIDDNVSYNFVGPGFFATAGIPLLMGREFTMRDRPGAPQVAIVNESFAREYFPGQTPLGQRFGDEGPKSAGKLQIIGVVKDARYTNLRLPPRPAVFQSLWQFTQAPFVLHVRVTGNPERAVAAVRREVQAVDKALTIYAVRTMTEQANGTMLLERTFATLCGLLGLLALGLCCVGLYGVASYSVTRRTNEIGIRVALGAARADVLWLILRETLVLLVVGTVIGVPVALAGARLIKSLLFGLRPADPVSVAIAMLVLGGVTVLACLQPARRATKVDPIIALRYE